MPSNARMLLVLATLTVAAPFAAHAQTVLTEKTLSLNAAVEAANGALENCRKDGYKVSITVLDHRGQHKAVLHDDGANPHTIENSLRKAYTALTYKAPSGTVGKRIAADPALAGILLLDKLTSVEGALPIKSGNDVVGAIGVSGAPGGDKDAVCAQAGIDKIAKGLSAT